MIEFLLQVDSGLFFFVNSHHSPFFDRFFFIITQLGSGWIAVPLTAVIIIFVTPRPYLAKALLCAAAAGILAGTVNTQIKKHVNRPRPISYFEAGSVPEGGSPVNESVMPPVRCIGKVLRYHSFPSGHTATVFAAAAILFMLYGGYFYYGIIPALLVAYSRVYMGVHFPLDIAGGAVLGSAVSILIIAILRKKRYLPPPEKLRGGHA